jgi:hypothetical protein
MTASGSAEPILTVVQRARPPPAGPCNSTNETTTGGLGCF